MYKYFTVALRKCRSAIWRFKLWIKPPINAYTTHLPVLIGLPRLKRIARVLELGCGPYSTLAFLDRSIYPDLEEIISYETDPQWANKLQQMAGNDARLKINLVSDPVAESVARIHLDEFDLIFVDDSTYWEGRAGSIKTVLSKPLGDAWVVLHDLENPLYQAVVPVDELSVQEFKAFSPHTWVVWPGSNPRPSEGLAGLSHRIEIHAPNVRPERCRTWLRLLTSV